MSSRVLHSIRKEKYFLLTLLPILSLIFFLSFHFHIGEGFFMHLLPYGARAENIFIQCLNGKNDREHEKLCLKNEISQNIGIFGVSTIMRAFSDYAKRRGETIVLHNFAHILGEESFHYLKDIKKTLVSCASSVHNGCHHGAVIAFLEANPNAVLDPEQFVPLCADTTKTSGGYQLCLHGLGHSFFVLSKGDLISALKECDKLGLGGFVQNQCWSGAFMENASGAHYTFHKERMADDPLYPCSDSLLQKRYMSACYSQLPPPSGKVTAGQRFSICRLAPEQWINSCARGLGIGIAAWRTSFYGDIIRYCRVGNDLATFCLEGAIHYILVGEDGEKKIKEFCALLNGKEKNICQELEENDSEE